MSSTLFLGQKVFFSGFWCLVPFFLCFSGLLDLQNPPLVLLDQRSHVALVACRDDAVHLLEKLHQSLDELGARRRWVLPRLSGSRSMRRRRSCRFTTRSRQSHRRIANRDDCGCRRRLCRSRSRGRGQHTIADHTTRHPPSPPHGKGGVSQNAPRLLLGIEGAGVNQLEAQDSVERLDVEELMD